MNFLTSGIDLVLSNSNKRSVKINQTTHMQMPVYGPTDLISGKVVIKNKIQHKGIKVALIGQIELSFTSNKVSQFTFNQQQLIEAATTNISTIPFEFSFIEKPYESYYGKHIKVRYFVKVTMDKLISTTKEADLCIMHMPENSLIPKPIRMEVGIEECLHLEFEFPKERFSINDVLVGKVNFLLVRIKVKHMELQILKREIAGSHPNKFNDTEIVTKLEIMDGPPVKGDVIPIRLFFLGLDLSPTYVDVDKKFSVSYFLNLVLVDEENRRYFKQQEIIFYRSDVKPDWKDCLFTEMMSNKTSQELLSGETPV